MSWRNALEPIGPVTAARIDKVVRGLLMGHLPIGCHRPFDLEALLNSIGIDVEEDDGWSAERVQGMALPSEELIILRSGLAPPLRREVLAHEAAHHVIPWHAAQVEASRSTVLSKDAADVLWPRFESEAEHFASELLLGDDFDAVCRRYEMRIDLPVNLARELRVTIKFAIRRYVLSHGRASAAFALPVDTPAPELFANEHCLAISAGAIGRLPQLVEPVTELVEKVERLRAKPKNAWGSDACVVRLVDVRGGKAEVVRVEMQAHSRAVFALVVFDASETRSNRELPQKLLRLT